MNLLLSLHDFLKRYAEARKSHWNNNWCRLRKYFEKLCSLNWIMRMRKKNKEKMWFHAYFVIIQYFCTSCNWEWVTRYLLELLRGITCGWKREIFLRKWFLFRNFNHFTFNGKPSNWSCIAPNQTTNTIWR